MLTVSFGLITWRRVASTLDIVSYTIIVTNRSQKNVVDQEITNVLMTSSLELTMSQGQDHMAGSATVRMVAMRQILMSAVVDLFLVWTISSQTVGVGKKTLESSMESQVPVIARPSAKTTMDVNTSHNTLKRDPRDLENVIFMLTVTGQNNVTGKNIVFLDLHILTWMTVVKHLNCNYEIKF